MTPADFPKCLRKKPTEESWPEKTTVVECSHCGQRLTFVGRVVLFGWLEWCSCGGVFSPIYTWTPEEGDEDGASKKSDEGDPKKLG